MSAHSMVFREGDPAGKVFTLIEGFAKLTRLLPDGKQQTVDAWKRPEKKRE